MDLVERFINYTKFDTQSSEDSESVPSTAKQLDFAKYLKHELLEVTPKSLRLRKRILSKEKRLKQQFRGK